MQLQSIFAKPVDRPIEGVIKADDDASLRIEVDEYVLTNEVEKRLESFLDAYNHHQSANGVWISGFFGSGKSHLLKMLALLLANREIDDRVVADTFLEKCEENKILAAAITKAVAIPSKSILFNIDQKADVISKTQIDALLSVFVKVFDESCGYYGKQGYIAQFERQLDEDGLLDGFVQEFATLEPNGWEWGRVRVNRVSSKIDAAYEKVTGQAVKGIIDRYKADYKVSIEDFADNVNAFIQKQKDKNFRLNFYVDEVGQYVADNTKLMTNLQTVAESLATKCNGKAWIIVTAQEDMNTVVGEMGKQQGNDFSKIQARFANRMKLTSQDVAEVIQKRLLSKTTEGTEQLQRLYEEQSNNFKTLFDFADGSQTYRNFHDQQHFVNCYPFVPYQFSLFQSAIQNLSQQNAFEGRHSSVGERSMLGVFQQVAVQISGHTLGELATFDLMFEGIRSALKSHIQRSILVAENNLDNPLAIRLLKALFLVKYVREFKPTIRNLCVLMLDRFDRDLPALRDKIEAALNVLENQVYIQRNGDLYEYLTDEEKDVEQEIKNTDVDTQDVSEELSKIIFDQVLKTRKLRYEETKQDYPVTRKLDDRISGREHELCVHVISPFHDEFERIDNLKMQSMGRPELLVVLPADDRLIRDLTLYKQTAKYISQNISLTQQESIKRILTDKTFTNKERLADIVQNVKDSLGEARMFVANSEIESNSHDPGIRIHDGFEKLILQTYTNLKLLRGITYTESNIEQCLTDAGDSLFGSDATAMSEAETEMLSLVSRNTQKGIRTTVKGLVEDFERRPFGWYLAAILCNLAKLCGRGKVEARSDGEALEDAPLATALRNTRAHGNIVLEPQIEFTVSQIRRVKDFYHDFFDRPPKSSEAKSLGEELANGFKKLHEELSVISAKSSTYPFVSILTEPVGQLQKLGAKSFKYFFTEFEPLAESLLDLKEETLDPIRRFMSGSSSDIYANACSFYVTQEPNLSYIDDPGANRLKGILDDPGCYRGNGMQEVKSLLSTLEGQVKAKVKDERAKAKVIVDGLHSRVKSTDEYAALSDEQKAEALAPFERIESEIECQTLIAVIRDAVRRFEDEDYQELLSKVERWTQPASGEGDGDDGKTDDGGQTPKKPEYVSVRSLRVAFDKAWLEKEPDVDRYLEALKANMLERIAEGKRIQI